METSEEQLLSAVKREFRRLDADENGYIPADALQGVLVTLGVDLTAEELVRYLLGINSSCHVTIQRHYE